MAPADTATVAPRCTWDHSADFLLLPGDGLILANGDGVITYFDLRARQLMGREPGCRCGDRLDEIWPELAEVLEEHALVAGRSGPVVTRVGIGDRLRTVNLFRSDCGIGIVLLADRCDANGTFHQQLLMHQRILQHVRDAVIVTTAEPMAAPGPVIIYANPAALRQTGYRLGEVLGRSPRIFQGPDTDPAALRTLREAMRHWQPARQKLLNYRKDGSGFWVEIDIAPLEDSDGWYTYWVSVQRDCRRPGRSS